MIRKILEYINFKKQVREARKIIKKEKIKNVNKNNNT